MKKAKKLTLQKKTIRELTSNELGSVAGGMTMITKCVTTGDVPCHTAATCVATACGETGYVICG